MSCQWNILKSEYFLLKNLSSVEFRILNMITVCCCFAHSFKTMARREPVVFEVFLPRTVQRLSSGRGVKGDVWYTRCIEGQGPEINEIWTFAEDGTREVHPFAWVQISDDSTRDKSLDNTRREKFKSDWLTSRHDFERVSKTTAYSNHIKNDELETREFFEREVENIPLRR